MSLLLRIAERVLNRPLLVHPDKVPFILAVLEGRIPLGDVSSLREVAEANVEDLPDIAQQVMRGPAPGASRFVGDSVERDEATGKPIARLPYQRTKDGTAIVTVTGSLINRGAFVGSSSGETSYEGIKHQLAMALADPKVAQIILDIESPGGEAVGAMEAAAAVRAAAAVKPVTAIVNGMAASAAYALASGATKIVTTPSGVVGSIGVVLMHADWSRAIDKAGITPTLIFAGAHKVDGNPFEPLPESVRADMQREVMQFYDLFVATVADGRKGLSPAAIRGTEARVFIGEEAVKAGLADEVGTFETVLAELSSRNSARLRASSGAFMETKTPQPAAGSTGITQEQHDAAVKAAAKASQTRIKAIVASEQAQGRAKLAEHLAYDTEMTVEAALGVLAAAPKEAATTAPGKTIAERMAGQGADLALGGPITTLGRAGESSAVVEAESPDAVYARRAKEVRAA